MKKKVMAGLLSVMLAGTMPMQVSAASDNSLAVTYGKKTTYMLSIPTKINLSAEQEVKAENIGVSQVNIAPDKKVQVKIKSGITNNKVELGRIGDTATKVVSTVTDKDGNGVSNNFVVAEFQDISTTPITAGTGILNFSEISDSAGGTVKAGAYTGTITFEAVTVNRQYSQLDVPEVTKMSLEPAYSKESFMTMEEALSSGVTLKMPGSISQERYRLAVAVYDSPDAADTSKIIYNGDGDQEGFWNYGALETLIPKSSQTTMEENLTNASYRLPFNTDYAGKWLKIAMRSISQSNISSEWSDEDDDGATTNYAWLQIPRLRVRTPNIRYGLQVMFYDSGEWNGSLDHQNPGDSKLAQTCMSFDWDDYADGYQIKLRHKGKSDSATGGYDDTVQYEDWIYLEEADKGIDVYYLSTDPAIKMDPTPNKVSRINPEAFYVDHISLGNYALLEYSGNFLGRDDPASTEFHTVCLIKSEYDRGRTIRVILPDIEEIDVKPVFKMFTLQASVQVKLSDDRLTRYADSEVKDWYLDWYPDWYPWR